MRNRRAAREPFWSSLSAILLNELARQISFLDRIHLCGENRLSLRSAYIKLVSCRTVFNISDQKGSCNLFGNYSAEVFFAR